MRGRRQAGLRRRARRPDSALTTPSTSGHVCYPRPPVGRGRTRSIRFALAAALVVIAAGVVAATASALSFDDATPCHGHSAALRLSGGLRRSVVLDTVHRSGRLRAGVRATASPNGALAVGAVAGVQRRLISGTPTVAGDVAVRRPTARQVGSRARGWPAWCDDTQGRGSRVHASASSRGLSIDNQCRPAGTIGVSVLASPECDSDHATSPGRPGSPRTTLTWSSLGDAAARCRAFGGRRHSAGAPTTEGSVPVRTFKARVDGRRSIPRASAITSASRSRSLRRSRSRRARSADAHGRSVFRSPRNSPQAAATRRTRGRSRPDRFPRASHSLPTGPWPARRGRPARIARRSA